MLDSFLDSGHFLLSRGGAPDEPYCHGQDTQDFYEITRDFYDAMKKDSSVINTYTIKSVMKVMRFSFVSLAQRDCQMLTMVDKNSPCFIDGILWKWYMYHCIQCS